VQWGGKAVNQETRGGRRRLLRRLQRVERKEGGKGEDVVRYKGGKKGLHDFRLQIEGEEKEGGGELNCWCRRGGGFFAVEKKREVVPQKGKGRIARTNLGERGKKGREDPQGKEEKSTRPLL